MKWALDVLRQIADIVQPEAGSQPSKVAGLDFEGIAGRRGHGLHETAPQGLVDDVAEGTAGASSQ